MSQVSRTMRRLSTTLREWRMVSRALVSTDHPILAHIAPTRRDGRDSRDKRDWSGPQN